MAFELNANLLPSSDAVFLLDANAIKGGLMSFADITARDNLPNSRRKVGLIAYTQSDKTYWRLAQVTPLLWEDTNIGKAAESFTVYDTYDALADIFAIVDADNAGFSGTYFLAANDIYQYVDSSLAADPGDFTPVYITAQKPSGPTAYISQRDEFYYHNDANQWVQFALSQGFKYITEIIGTINGATEAPTEGIPARYWTSNGQGQYETAALFTSHGIANPVITARRVSDGAPINFAVQIAENFDITILSNVEYSTLGKVHITIN